MPFIVVGVDKSGSVASEANDIVALVRIDSKGNTKTVSFKPKTKNPGQEVMQAAGEAEAIVMGLMQGPLNSKKEIVHVKPCTNIEKIVETHKQGKLYTTRKGYERKTEYNVPKQDSSGRGVGNIGRNPECGPEDYKEIGQGFGRRVTNANPQMKVFQGAQQNSGNAQNTIDNIVVGNNLYNIGAIVENYSDARTKEQKQTVAQATMQYLREAHRENLTGQAAVKYAANKLKSNGYSKINANSSKAKATAKKAA